MVDGDRCDRWIPCGVPDEEKRGELEEFFLTTKRFFLQTITVKKSSNFNDINCTTLIIFESKSLDIVFKIFSILLWGKSVEANDTQRTQLISRSIEGMKNLNYGGDDDDDDNDDGDKDDCRGQHTSLAIYT